MINEKCGKLTIVTVIYWLVGLVWITPVNVFRLSHKQHMAFLQDCFMWLV